MQAITYTAKVYITTLGISTECTSSDISTSSADVTLRNPQLHVNFIEDDSRTMSVDVSFGHGYLVGGGVTKNYVDMAIASEAHQRDNADNQLSNKIDITVGNINSLLSTI